jgi:DNA polymerase-3 subunit alpha
VVNRKCLESIAYAGGFDSLIDFNRSRFFAEDSSGVQYIESLIRYGQRMQQEKQNSQQSLFGMDTSIGGNIQPPRVPQVEDWNPLTILNKEREVIGLYMSSHPLDRFGFILRRACQHDLQSLQELTLLKDTEVALAGVVTSVTPLSTKDGRPYARFVLEDYNSQHEFTLFSKDYERFSSLIQINNFLFIRGRVQVRPYRQPEELEYKIVSIQHLADIADNITNIRIELDINEVCSSFTNLILETASEHKGKATLQFVIVDHNDDVRIKLSSKKYRVAPSTEFINFLDSNDINYFINI